MSVLIYFIQVTLYKCFSCSYIIIRWLIKGGYNIIYHVNGMTGIRRESIVYCKALKKQT